MVLAFVYMFVGTFLLPPFNYLISEGLKGKISCPVVVRNEPRIRRGCKKYHLRLFFTKSIIPQVMPTIAITNSGIVTAGLKTFFSVI